MGKPGKPIARYYNFGVTFRWIRGESHIAVKPGYVCEGQASIVVRDSRTFVVQDRVSESPDTDRHTWIAAIPVNPSCWQDDRYFVNAVKTWADGNPRLGGGHLQTGW